MDKDDAQILADRLVELILTHQPSTFAPVTANVAGGAFVAQAVASMRKTLIEELQKQ